MADPTSIGRYELIEAIGRGGMGKVYRARDPWMDRFVAVKTIELDAGDDREEAQLRVVREIRASAKLAHPNIVQVYDVGQHDSLAFIVMELVEGRPPRGPLAPGAVLALVRQMAAALDFAHSHGIVHRDIKPANVLVDAAGQAKVLDFGIARMAGERSLTRTGLTAGTPFYMAPEQLQGGGVGPPADQYALGVTAYELLTGAKPFSGDSFASVICAVLTTEPPPMASVPPAVEAAVRRALAKDPAARHASCTGFAEALAAAIRSAAPEPTVPVRPPPSKPSSPAPARADRTIVWAAVASLLLFAAGALGIGWALLGRAGPEKREPARTVAPVEETSIALAPETPPDFENWGGDASTPSEEDVEPAPAGEDASATFGEPLEEIPLPEPAEAAKPEPPVRAAVAAAPVVRRALPPVDKPAERPREPAPEPDPPKAPAPPSEPAAHARDAVNGANGAAVVAPAVERKPGQLSGAEIDGATFEFVWIPPGAFEMGCSPGDRECAADEQPRRRVGVSPGFEMARHETTQAQWNALMDANPSRFPGADRPVDSVSWNDVQAYLAKLDARRDGYRYRLPTEAEWEYAARAGSAAARWGELDRIAWHSGNAGRETHPVGGKRPNAWGLHDMLGNVAEWCADWYAADAYASAAERSPRGPASGSARVVRGGSWFDLLPGVFRVSRRGSSPPGLRLRSFGFRLVRERAP